MNKKSLLKSASLNLASIYNTCDPRSYYKLTFKDQNKCLTIPSKGFKNNYMDNEAVFVF
jgi:hypothetical protein